MGRGSAKTSSRSFLDLEIWKTLQRFSIGELSAAAAATEITAVTTRDFAERLRTNPDSVERRSVRSYELATRVNDIAADTTAGTKGLPRLAAFARVYTLFATPEIVQRWQQDRTFALARQYAFRSRLPRYSPTHRGADVFSVMPIEPALTGLRLRGRTYCLAVTSLGSSRSRDHRSPLAAGLAVCDRCEAAQDCTVLLNPISGGIVGKVSSPLRVGLS
jgi:hypothetical protein